MLTNRKIALLIILFIGLLVWRSPMLFTEPRFWGEEGRYYYEALQTSRWSVFTLVVRGNFQLITNFGAAIATLVPAAWAPAVTTYLGLLTTLLFIYFFCRFAVENHWSFYKSALIVLIFALLAQGYEVYLSADNAQWMCSVSLLFICLLGWDDLGVTGKYLLYLWIALCALSGVPSAVLAPIFLIRGTKFRSPLHLRLGTVLAIGAVIQGMVIYLHPHPDRVFSPTPLLLTAPWLLQTIASPLITADGTDRLIDFLNQKQSIYAAVSAYVTLTLIATFAIFAGFREAKYRVAASVLVVAWIWVPTVQIFGMLGNPNALISGWIHGRYFFLGVICFVMLLGIAAHSDKMYPRQLATVILFVIACAGVYQVHHGDWKNSMVSGPSWRNEISQCEGRRPCQVHAWPGGPDWAFMLYLR
ncbi:hypothetical protein PQR52_07860 [Paraburkholderia aspalathi]|uniref:hypothetical protein n=1 Tax=Paraburkholderia aspalathi TaxID=1324617 RepID=UPI0038BC47D8